MKISERVAKRNRAKGQISMARGSIDSILRDCSKEISTFDKVSLRDISAKLHKILDTWDKHFIGRRYGKKARSNKG